MAGMKFAKWVMVSTMFLGGAAGAFAQDQPSPIRDALSACERWLDQPRGQEFHPDVVLFAEEQTLHKTTVEYLSRTYPFHVETLDFLDSDFFDETSADFYCTIQSVDPASDSMLTAEGRKGLDPFRDSWQPLSRSEVRRQLDEIIRSFREDDGVVETTAIYDSEQSDGASFVFCEDGPIREVGIWFEDRPASSFGWEWGAAMNVQAIANSNVKAVGAQLRRDCPPQ